MVFLGLLWEPRQLLDLYRDTPHAAKGTGFAACKQALVEAEPGALSHPELPQQRRGAGSCPTPFQLWSGNTHWDKALAASIYFPQEKPPSGQWHPTDELTQNALLCQEGRNRNCRGKKTQGAKANNPEVAPLLRGSEHSSRLLTAIYLQGLELLFIYLQPGKESCVSHSFFCTTVVQ